MKAEIHKTISDESKFGKRKYQRGSLIEGQWVLGGICREAREIFLVALPENKRDRQTLEPLTLEHARSAGFHDHHRLLEGLR